VKPATLRRRGVLQAAGAAWLCGPALAAAQALPLAPPQAATLAGADATGARDATAAFRALFDRCIPAGLLAVLPAGRYRVSGPLANPASLPAGALHIQCQGDVQIELDPATAPFATLLSCHTAAANSSSINAAPGTAGRLNLLLNGRCANGIYLRHGGGDGGQVQWARMRVSGAYNHDATSTAENQALLVFGRYTRVQCSQIEVDGVDRANAQRGACKGLSISEINGPVDIEDLRVRRVLCTGGTADADGLSVFGHAPNGVYASRGGVVRVRRLWVEDCQGRSVKMQTQDVLLQDVTIRRQHVVSINTADIDFQVGGGQVQGLLLEYRRHEGVSPLGAGFYPVSFQQQCTDAPNRALLSGVRLSTEVPVPRLVYLTVGARAMDGELRVQDVDLQPLGTLPGPLVLRAVVELNAAQVAASAGLTHVQVQGLRGALGRSPVVGYTNSPDVAAPRLSVHVSGVRNHGEAAPALGSVSGRSITSLRQATVQDNINVDAPR
jgi:hypothetical protein